MLQSRRNPIAQLLAGLALVTVSLSTSCAAEPEKSSGADLELPAREPVPLKALGRLGPGADIECSGIAMSRRQPDLFWTLGDSGNPPRIYPVRASGATWHNREKPGEQGVLLEGAKNVDWEDIAFTADGRLIVADVGNNANARRDQTLYVIAEPQPDATSAPVLHKYLVRFPDQKAYPSPADDFNFDCEALFTVGNTIFLLTKHRSDTLTKLYRLDNPQPGAVNVLTLTGKFEARGLVTAADCSADGKRLAVLTYSGIWFFERQTLEQDFFSAGIRWAPLTSPQMESIVIRDDQTLLLADEMLREVFEVKIAELSEVRAK